VAGESALPAARLEDKLRSRNLPTLEELDEELRERGATVDDLSARVASERRPHRDAPGEPGSEETADVAAPEPGGSEASTAEESETNDQPALKETGADGP
jgi:hypothetical protein